MSETDSAPESPSSSPSTYRTPRWVIISGIVALVLILLVIIVIATGLGGEHGPGRHNPTGTPEHQSSVFVLADRT